MLIELKQIINRPKVLLLGNGLFRSYGSLSWENLLGKISAVSFEGKELEAINQLNFPLQALIYTGDNVDEGVNELAEELVNIQVVDEYSKVINSIVDIDFDAILTTNYTYDVEKSIDKEFNVSIGRASKYRKRTCVGNAVEEQFGLYRFLQVKDNNIWHIHGEAARKDSMILGHYYYGKLVSCLQSYISSFLRRYKSAEVNDEKFRPSSWIDYFMLGDVYIVGLGLDQSEFDLWWLINCKKRHSKELLEGNVFWFEPNLANKVNFAKRQLAEVNDVKIIDESVGKRDFKNYYENLIKKIEVYK